MTETELGASIAADPDKAGMVIDWTRASADMPEPRAGPTMRGDADVLAFFKDTGRGYQTRINSVLRAFVETLQRRLR